MPTFIVAGVQRSLVQRVNLAIAAGKGRLSGWRAIVFPSQQNDRCILTVKQVDEVRKKAADEGGAHILALSDDRNRDSIEQALSPYFRFRWFDTAAIRKVGGGVDEPMLLALERAAVEETLWIDAVKPKTCASPLILPLVFRPNRNVESLWRLATAYNDIENTKAAQRLIERFERDHRRKVDGFNGTPWVDEGRWIWDDDGSRHGEPEFPEGWKYSFCLPNGFHFDVRSEGKRNGTFIDAKGIKHPLKKGYLNITAHGLVRGQSD